jgi:iron uptake system component EfeO
VSRTKLLVVPLLMVAMVAAGCGDDGDSSSNGDTGGDAKTQTIEVALTDVGCDPHDISAKAGPTTFHVTNEESDSVTEFEVVNKDDDKILGEVENIPIGIDRSFSLNLKEGSYRTRCNGGSKEWGTLEVAKSGTGETADSEARKKAVDTYLDYVQSEADQLVPAVTAFAEAVKAGDVEQAKAQFASARTHYETIEPIAESFGDLDPRIDAREGDVPEDEWGGFHKIEKAIFQDGTTDGMAPVADQLVADVTELQGNIAGIELDPSQVANGAVALLNEVSASKITGEEDRYSGTDLSDFAANVDGSKAAFEAVAPLLAGTQDELVSTIEDRFADVTAGLDQHKDPASIANGYALYTTLKDDPEVTKDLSARVDALAEPLSKVAALVLQ